MCLRGGGGVCMRKSIVRWRKRDYMSQQRGGGGGEKEGEYLGGSYTKVFCVMEPEPQINNFGSAILVFFKFLFRVNNV